MDIKKQFIRYVSQNMLGMLGMSLYILADTYFISKAVGADGITALNLVLPVYNLIFAIGAMIGVGSAIRFVIERNKKNPEAESYFFHALLRYHQSYIYCSRYLLPRPGDQAYGWR